MRDYLNAALVLYLQRVPPSEHIVTNIQVCQDSVVPKHICQRINSWLAGATNGIERQVQHLKGHEGGVMPCHTLRSSNSRRHQNMCVHR